MIRPLFAALMFVGLCSLAVSSQTRAADPDAEAVKKAEALIKAEEKRIWRLAHITVKKHTKCECAKPVATATGFKLTYTFAWSVKEKGKEVDHTTKLAFSFNPAGGFEGVPTADILEVVSDSSKTPPFQGAGVALIPLKAYMKTYLAKLPLLLRVLIQKEIDEKLSAERMLELWLMFREHVGPPDDKDDK